MIKFKEFAPKIHQFQDHKLLSVLSLSFWEQRVNHTFTLFIDHALHPSFYYCSSTKLPVAPMVAAVMRNIFIKLTSSEITFFSHFPSFLLFLVDIAIWWRAPLHMVNRNTRESRGRRVAALLETRHKQKHASQVWQMPRKSPKDYLEVQFTIRVSTCNMIYLFNQNSYFFKAIGCRVVFIKIVQIHKLCISCDYMHLQHYIRKARRGKNTRKKNECWGSSVECRPVILTSAGYVFSSFESQNINRFLSFSLRQKTYCLYASLPCWSNDLLAKSKRWPGILSSTESKQSCLWTKILRNVCFLFIEVLAIVSQAIGQWLSGGQLNFCLGTTSQIHFLCTILILYTSCRYSCINFSRGQHKTPEAS